MFSGSRHRHRFLTWFVIQVRPQPPLDFGQRHSLGGLILKNLIAAEFADREIFRSRMSEIGSADGTPRPHRITFRELDAGALFHPEQVPESSLLRVIGT